ncbi:MAG: alpha/beta hydrolase [Bacteroidales bacterium]|nr:alpha/beta hydrolase [Bacteroidales bacterium]
MKKLQVTFVLLALISQQLFPQYHTRTYKNIDTVHLELNIYYPGGEKTDVPLPAIVFFFGGGWVKGDPGHFSGQCKYLASKGIVAIAPDYRTRDRHGTTPLESLADAKSAIRYIRKNAEELGIKADRIAVGGGSAGGYLALACATVDDFTSVDKLRGVSARPDALILFNPVVNTWKDGLGESRFGDLAFEASPLHQLQKGLPPTLIFHGTDDQVVEIDDIRKFSKMANENGDVCILKEFEDRGHGFFNRRQKNDQDYFETLYETEKFLIDRNFMPVED